MSAHTVPDRFGVPDCVATRDRARALDRTLHCPPATHRARTGIRDFTVTSLSDGGRRVTGTYTGGPAPIEIWVEFDPGSRFQYVAVQLYRPVGADHWLDIYPSTQDPLSGTAQQVHGYALSADADADADAIWVARATVQRAERRLQIAAEALHRIRLNLASGTPYTDQVSQRIRDEQAIRIPLLQRWRALARAGRYADGAVLALAVELVEAHPEVDVDVVLAALGADPATTSPSTNLDPAGQR